MQRSRLDADLANGAVPIILLGLRPVRQRVRQRGLETEPHDCNRDDAIGNANADLLLPRRQVRHAHSVEQRDKPRLHA